MHFLTRSALVDFLHILVFSSLKACFCPPPPFLVWSELN